MNDIYGVFGTGGYGREVMPMARSQLIKNNQNINDLFFVIDDSLKQEDKVNGIRVMSVSEFLNIKAQNKYLNIAIADSSVRSSIKQRPSLTHINDWSIIAENCVIMDSVEIGLGAILSPFVTITSNARIGRSFHANLYSYVAHDCHIGDYVTFAPGVKCNGNIIIEDHVYIGAGAIIRPGEVAAPLVIEKGAVIGMGSVVTKSIPAGATVFGNPAKVIKK